MTPHGMTPGVFAVPREIFQIEGGEISPPAASAHGVRVYKGLPFAAPPVGAMRWRAPRPVVPWTGVRSCETFGPNSLQGQVFDDIDPFKDGVSEDCLYLNVFTPASPAGADRLPVMVWIHGGGFVVGSGSEPRYDGSALAARGIVVVTLNHRLNMLGFLAHPELSAEDEHGASGAYAMLDIVAALRWVRRNISQFGGDPQRITIAGESAGSMAVSALMASPLAKGLFHRAIGQSGAMFGSPARRPASRAEAEEHGLAFMRKVGARDLAQLRAAPAEAILAAAPGLGCRPIVDGHFLPKSPAEIFAASAHADVPLLAGWNKDEGFNFTLLPDREGRDWNTILRATFGARASEAAAFYPADAKLALEASAARLGADLTIVHGAWAWIEAHKAHGSADSFRFVFDRCPRTPPGWFGNRDSATAGAFHAGELLYVFDTLDAFPWLIDEADRELARTTTRYWLNFIASGNPNGDGLPRWPSFREAGSPVMHLDAHAAAAGESERERQLFLAACVGAP